MMMLLDMLAAEVTFLHRDAIRRVGVGWCGGGGGAREGRGVERCKGWLRKHVAELLHSEGRPAGKERYFW